MFGETTGSVRTLLRIEGVCVLFAALTVYAKLGLSWKTFALFFLTPDLSLLGYLAGSRLGSVSYNMAHSYIGAVACLTMGFVLAHPMMITAGLIWGAHIGFDRTLGYGLKYAAGFGFTHLGPIGRLTQNKV